MRKLTLLILTLMALFSGKVLAGYTYRNGYYYSGGHGYSKYYQPGYYSYGYYYQPYYFYQYEPSAPAYTVPTTTNSITYNSDWKTEALKVAKARDDIGAFERTLAALGYPYSPLLSSSAYKSPVITGSTLYGYPYSVKSSTELYGNLDLNAGFASAARLAQGSQEAGSEATRNVMSILQQAGANQADVAKILAEGMARKAIQEGSALAARSTTTTTVNGVTPAPAAPPAMAAASNGGDFLKVVGVPRCGKCHTGADAKGNFRIADFTAMKDKTKVYERVLSEDPKKQMPPPSDQQLTVAELKRILTQ